MNRIPFVSLAAAVCAALVASSGTAARAQAPAQIELESGHSVVIATPHLTRLAVGDSRIAGVTGVTGSQLVVSGRAPGRTSVIVWRGGEVRTYEVVVTEQSLGPIAAMLRASLAEPGVSVATVGRSIVVHGAVDDSTRYAVLGDVVQRFQKLETAQKYSIVNAVTVAHPFGTLDANVARMLGPNDVRFEADGKGNVVVSGHVKDRIGAQWVLEQARGLAGAYLGGDGKVIDRLTVATVSQVNVKVRIYEVDKTALDQIGLRLQSASTDPATGVTVLGPPPFTLLEQAKGLGKALTVGGFSRITQLAPTLDLLVSRGDAKLLSEPDLLTMPGNEASFLVGGEIPVPVSSTLGAVTVLYKEYGVRLKVTPAILGNGSIETKVNPEVSDLDFADGVSLNGFVIPALKTSRLTTDVVTASGESIVLGGLLRRVEQRTIQKIPLLSSLPILGALFRSTRYLHSETDVIFVMTPRI